MNERFNIRSAQAEDAQRILEMEYQLALHQRANMERFRLTEEIVARNIADPQRGEYLVASARAAILGFTYFGYTPTVGWSGESPIYIESLYVEPETRGAGLGRRLIAEVASRAVKYAGDDPMSAEIRLDTARYGNDKTQAFYRSQGFSCDELNFRLSGVALKGFAAPARKSIELSGIQG